MNNDEKIEKLLDDLEKAGYQGIEWRLLPGKKILKRLYTFVRKKIPGNIMLVKIKMVLRFSYFHPFHPLF